MTRLPSRPFGNTASNASESENQPRLGATQPSVPSTGVNPQIASETPAATPSAPRVPSLSSTRSEAVPAAPEVISAPETPALSIETLSFETQASNELIEAQKRQAEAINKLPENLKISIKKLFDLIMDDSSSEVTLNGPRNVGFKKAGQRFFDNDIDFIDTTTYHSIINSFLLPLTNTHDRIGETPYLIEGQLVIPDNTAPNQPPLVARVHIVAPPAVTDAKITIAKKARQQYTISRMVDSGTLTQDMGNLLIDLAKGRATIVFSGLSGSGKTTLLEALSREFDISDRIILVEDTEELSLPVSDVVSLRSHQARPGEDQKENVTLEWLVRQANRMRPDRIIVGEVRGGEMAEFLTAANSGADGSMTTVHASSPQQAINKMLSLSLKSDSVKSETSILRDIASTVQIIVQMSLIDGRHVISQIEEVSNTVNQNTLGIQTSTIFRFDRNTERFTYENRLSDELQSFLRQRGVQVVNPTNFMPSRGTY